MRNMRKCKGKYTDFIKGKWINKEFELGYFHGWGMNCEEFGDIGVGNYTVAIIELQNGKVITTAADNIQFLEPYSE